MLKNFISALETVRTNNYRVTRLANGKEAIQQTERNALKASLANALTEDLSAIFPQTDENGKISAYYIDGDVVLEIPNESIADKITVVDGSGAISVTLSIKVNGLEYDARIASEDYQERIAEKAAKKAEDAAKKARKIAADKALREAKAKAKAERG